MYPDQLAPFALTAMTLRGIGSYIDGARLEIKPFTVLCGPNGSGKSTWLKTLRMLQRSLDGGFLPWRYDIADWDVGNIRVTNALIHLARAEDLARLSSPQVSEQYGPPTTIGLESVANRQVVLEPIADDNPAEYEFGTPACVFWQGWLKSGTKVRIRIAHPSYWSDEEPTPALVHLIELSIDGHCLIRLTGEREPAGGLDQRTGRPSRSSLYHVYVSPQLLPSLGSSLQSLIHLGTIVDLQTLKCESAVEGTPSVLVERLVAMFERRIRQLFKEILGGFFYLEAIRLPNKDLFINESDDRSPADRHVGTGGELAWQVQRRWHKEPLREFSFHPFTADNVTLEAGELLSRAGARQQNSRLQRLWDCSNPVLRSELAHAFSHKRSTTGGTGDLALQFGDYNANQVLDLIVRFLNDLLSNQRLFDYDTWADSEEGLYDEFGDPVDSLILDPEIRYLGKRSSELSDSELRRLNYLLIVDAFRAASPNYALLTSLTSYPFDDYVSAWLETLTTARFNIDPDIAQRYRKLDWSGTMPTGLALFPDRSPPWVAYEDTGLSRILHPCFGRTATDEFLQPPAQLSAGFHQVFPVIVQMGLMRSGELLGLENPEVHLHPSLQLRFVEALMAHVQSGRRFIVETHSDLVIRRVLRAILQEELPQTGVQIYFTELRPCEIAGTFTEPMSFVGSVVNPIEVDQHGRIANWPEGFLDDDVRESQRLMDVMYGRDGEEDDDDNE